MKNLIFDCYVSSDKSKLDIDKIMSLMKQSYWAMDRSEETLKKSIENSICYGMYHDNNLVGFGRVVTDYSTVYWICDVIIDVNCQGNGLGKQLMQSIMSTQELDGLLGILATKDAHGLYEQYGFIKEPHKFMMKKRTKL
ncbi:GNAT family N-acetyltransferase [Alkaliphilus hydrothermalis]|uniref:GNAT family N-acyltransferase n=1 Tax=Alkaliphilus hydrothermalis TaxID=1482730 RepID=A0ABS2NPI9_9FIRM|nr:GNAT family N-acetyltransferase [Alkaliphilus hydrothermalis]MBM7614865.1 putative GNAT family N-acyltransferase [Alkaliphilus hydrothermalis]